MSSEMTASQPPAGGDASTADVDLSWLTLDDDESVLWASTQHKSSLVPALIIGIPLSFVLIGIPILISAYLNFTNTNYVVTTRGLYRKRGILSRDVKQIGFDKVQNISYTQTAVGSQLGYGTVEISTAGSSGVELQFRNIPTPADIQELISREIERREGPRRDDTDRDVDAVLDAILSELRGIRQALDETASESTDTPVTGTTPTDTSTTDTPVTGTTPTDTSTTDTSTTDNTVSESVDTSSANGAAESTTDQ